MSATFETELFAKDGFRNIHTALTSIDVANASARKEEDKQRILAELETRVGVVKANEDVTQLMKEWLKKQAKGVWDKYKMQIMMGTAAFDVCAPAAFQGRGCRH